MHPKGFFKSLFDVRISFQDLKLVYSRSFEMNWQQTHDIW